MSIKKALFYTFIVGAACVFFTWFLGHLWVFVILIIATVTGIILSASGGDKKSDSDRGR